MPHFGEPVPEGPGKRRFCRITTGTYTGDGELAQAITGIGFPPKYVWIVAQPVAEATAETFETVDAMTPTWCIRTSDTSRQNRIVSLDADGFTVSDQGTDVDPNKLGQVYVFIALG